MNPETLIAPKITLQGQGRVVRAFGEEVIFHLEGKDTNGLLCLWTEITSPGGGPPPHYHENEDEWFFVQEGDVKFYVEGQWRDVAAGGTVFAPRRSVHTFKNAGARPSRLLIATSPSGFETFFTRCAVEFAKPGAPDMARIVEISAEHGIHFVQG